MTVILADEQFIEYYGINANRSGIVATIPWATTGKLVSVSSKTASLFVYAFLTMYTGVAQLFLGGTLADLLGRLWALRVAIVIMIIGVCVPVLPQLERYQAFADQAQSHSGCSKHVWSACSRSSSYVRPLILIMFPFRLW